MFNLKEKKWDWDLTKIKALGFTDNVLELMTKKIQLLDAKSQWILQIAACMGNQFDLKALSFILSHSPEKTLALLEKPIKEDLILPISDGYKMIEFNMQNSITDMNVEFKFSHDRIQQAVYSLLSESQKDEIHYRIGRHLLKKSSKNDISKIMISSTQKESMQSNMEKLDAASVMKISQAISGEIVFDRLLNKLMNIVIENAGAEKGFLILKSNKKMLIEAEAHAGQNNIQVLHSIPVKKKNNLSMAIINYVARTKKKLVLNNAAKEGMFTKDHYVMTNRPKSILCTPIMHKSNLTGILYLENNLLAGTFTDERLNMLQIVSSQIGISLENAKLYSSLAKQTKEVQKLNEQLEYRVTERTSALTASLAELNKTQGKLVQSEKMASLGELVSGIAHEINTPLGVIKLKYRPYQAIFKQNKPYQ